MGYKGLSAKTEFIAVSAELCQENRIPVEWDQALEGNGMASMEI